MLTDLSLTANLAEVQVVVGDRNWHIRASNVWPTDLGPTLEDCVRVRYLLSVVVVGILAVQVKSQGETSGSPMLSSYKQLQKFRQVYYPLLNKCYPANDYDAIFGAAPVVENAAIEYTKMQYDTHFNDKHRAFVRHRDSLAFLVKTYAEAALQFDTSTVRSLLPMIGEQFELSTAAMIPYTWREYDRLLASCEELYHFVTEGKDIKKAKAKVEPVQVVDTIAARFTVFFASPGPAEVQVHSELISEEKAYFSKLVDRMKALVISKDVEAVKFRQTVTELKVRLVTFERLYLQ